MAQRFHGKCADNRVVVRGHVILRGVHGFDAGAVMNRMSRRRGRKCGAPTGDGDEAQDRDCVWESWGPSHIYDLMLIPFVAVANFSLSN